MTFTKRSGNTPTVDFERIPQKTIQAYLQERNLCQVKDFKKLKATNYNPASADHYYEHSRTFRVEQPLEQVWRTYLSIPPRDTWRSPMVSFGCQYCQQEQELTYLEDDYDGLKTGQIIFLNISLFWGLVNIAVAHKITAINEAEKYIEFSYIEGGKTEGSQRLSFRTAAEGATEVVHRTLYKGSCPSLIREKYLYPFLHGRVIASFHKNVAQKITAVPA
ncbi:hypothetical protein GCM10027275_51920 [Rhabdobacter roseus]|uniref:DUF1990 domain-containing protein n=1 Tax=Rhabdobacter roseus TaxID=1655419 RepID=A0A840U0H8_9BACT|nr:SRPBCC family protein [Rhabdobacter roseus]MBB5287267.1 hypothetical protein [Rhabdobacter roseus]